LHKKNDMAHNELVKKFENEYNDADIIQGVQNWCDRWCERCNLKNRCSVYLALHIDVDEDTPEEWIRKLTRLFELATDLLTELEHLEKQIANDADKTEVTAAKTVNEDNLQLVSAYDEHVNSWLSALAEKDNLGVEVRLNDPVTKDCFDIIIWYHYFFHGKLRRALMSKDDEAEREDALGTAKLLLVSIERNIAAWMHIYQVFSEDEDDILSILVQLKKLAGYIELEFPDAKNFIRPGLDE